MNPLDLILVGSSIFSRKNRIPKRIQAETQRIEREDRQIMKLIEEQERARRRRINGL